MSHWDDKKPTRYRTKAGPEVVLRKVSVLFRYKFYAETGHRDRLLFYLQQVPYFLMALLLDNVHRKGDGTGKNMTFFALVCVLLWRFSFCMLTIGIRAKTF